MKGVTVKEILRKNGFTLADVAKRLGESSQNFSSLLSKDDIRSSLIERIADATGLPISAFYEDTGIAVAQGEHASAIVGNNNVTHGESTASFLAEIAAQRKITETCQAQNAKSQEQIDRLLGLLEQTQQKQ